ATTAYARKQPPAYPRSHWLLPEQRTRHGRATTRRRTTFRTNGHREDGVRCLRIRDRGTACSSTPGRAQQAPSAVAPVGGCRAKVGPAGVVGCWYQRGW